VVVVRIHAIVQDGLWLNAVRPDPEIVCGIENSPSGPTKLDFEHPLDLSLDLLRGIELYKAVFDQSN
jgi:hypothetical protein